MGEIVDLDTRRRSSPVHRSGDGWNATRWENPDLGIGGYIVTRRKQAGEGTPVRFRLYDDEVAGLHAVVTSMVLDQQLRAANRNEPRKDTDQ